MEKKKCVQCGKEFTLTDSEKQFFESRNLSLPKRCKECREKNNPWKMKTNPEQATLRKERTFKIERIFLIPVILFIAFCIFYIYRNNNSEESNIAQKAAVSDSSYNNSEENNITQKAANSDRGYTFKSKSLLQEHFDKHGSEFGYENTSQYESGANAVINSPDALHKKEAEDGDSIYYIEATNELVILSTDGYIRTYFKPEDGIDYYNRQ